VREARRTRQTQMAAEFFRRWNEDSLVEARRLIASFASREELGLSLPALCQRERAEGGRSRTDDEFSAPPLVPAGVSLARLWRWEQDLQFSEASPQIAGLEAP
jgi:hypothetical protein